MKHKRKHKIKRRLRLTKEKLEEYLMDIFYKKNLE